MNRTVLRSRIGADGVLRVTLPLGKEVADREVQLTVEPVTAPATMTQEEWAAWVQSVAGSITDPTFRRHDQGEYEQREPLA